MTYPDCYIWVEGSDDADLIKKTRIKSMLEKIYGKNKVRIQEYVQRPSEEINKAIKTSKNQKGDYYFIADHESYEYICKSNRKNELIREYDELETNRIILVIKEGESWYLAGLDDKNSKRLGIPALRRTDNIGKKQFEKYQKRSKNPRTFKIDIINAFSTKLASRKNESFRRFMIKTGLVK